MKEKEELWSRRQQEMISNDRFTLNKNKQIRYEDQIPVQELNKKTSDKRTPLTKVEGHSDKNSEDEQYAHYEGKHQRNPC